MGEWAFLIGFVIAIVVSLVSVSDAVQGWLVLLLVVLGLIVGFLNVSERESTPFLVAAAALLIAGTTGGNLAVIPWIGSKLQAIVQNVAVFVTPAAIVVAIKSVRSLAKD